MRKKLATRALVGTAAAALCVFALPVVAQTTTAHSVGATCSGGGQLCNNLATFSVTTTGLLQSTFIGGSALCSNIRIHYFVDGVAGPVTGFVGASGSTGSFNLGPVSAGSHTIGLQAEGQTGGCNSGTLAAWAGTAQVTVGAVAQAPIPALGPLELAALAALLAAGGSIALRRTRHRGG
jgi:hypothetical protein